MAELVPLVKSLKDVYEVSSKTSEIDAEHQSRFKKLLTSFHSNFGQKADFVARSPGRVNIIGEHVDYSLYNVLPAAVTVDVLIATKVVSSSPGGRIQVANLNPSKYPTREITIPEQGDVEIDKENHDWSNYFRAGLQGALQFLRKKHTSFAPRSMQVLIDGNVPAGGGLSSSAAFVCASALAVMKAHDHDASKQDLLELAIVSERSVGVYSGGMDQAASIFSQRGFLLYCRFFPSFHAEHVPMPPSDPPVTFLVAQSFITSDKAVTAPKHYNLRVVEVTLATVVLAKLHGITLNPDDSSLGFSLRNFQHELMKKEGKLDSPLEDQLDTMIHLTKRKLTQPSYTREDISSILFISVSSLEKTYMSKFPIDASSFKLWQRAMHVFTEARRVLEFKGILSAATTGLDHNATTRLGDLMNETQASCSDIYECSSPEIDQICTIAIKAGALGSRVTGAGWGGCTVHLVPQTHVDKVIDALKKEYYYKQFPDITEEKLREAFVVSTPGTGSSVIAGAALDA